VNVGKFGLNIPVTVLKNPSINAGREEWSIRLLYLAVDRGLIHYLSLKVDSSRISITLATSSLETQLVFIPKQPSGSTSSRSSQACIVN